MREWHKNGINLYNGDCMEGLCGMADNSFVLLIADTPYGIGEDGSKNHTRSNLAVSQDYRPYSCNDKCPPGGIF